jgi:hypothetical protein
MFEPGEAAASPEATSQDDSSNSGSPDSGSPDSASLDDDSTEGDSTEDDSSAGDSPAEPDPQTTPSQRVPNHDLIEAILAALLKNAQPEIDGLLAAGRFRLAHGKAAEAERMAAEALKLDPQSVEANLLAIEASLQSREMALVEGDRDRAAAAREQAVERATTLAAGADADWRVLQILAQLRVEEDQIDEAEQCIRRAIAAVEQGRTNLPLATRNSREIIDRQFQVHWALADLLLSPAVQRDPVRREQASAELDSLAKTLEKMQIRREVAQLLEARRLVAEGQWARAAGRLEQLRTDFYGVPRALRTLDEALLECYEQLQNPDAKIRAYRRALIEILTARTLMSAYQQLMKTA